MHMYIETACTVIIEVVMICFFLFCTSISIFKYVILVFKALFPKFARSIAGHRCKPLGLYVL